MEPSMNSQTSATVFTSGNSQAIRLPKKFQLHTKHVSIERRSGGLFLRELPNTMADLILRLPVIADAPLDLKYEGDAEPVQAW
jgi:antitoxin VapB